MSFVEGDFGDAGVVVCRTGYTGERGYELIARNDVAVELWDALLAAGEEFGMLACGLGARDTLRTEMGYPLHGQDITLDVTPNQARLGWAVGWKKDAFWGRDVLLAEKEAGPQRLLRGLAGRRPRHPASGHERLPHPRRPPRRDHLRHLLPDPPQGHRAGAGADLRQRRRRGGRRRPRATRDLPLDKLRRSWTRPCESREPSRPAPDLPTAHARRAPLVLAARERRRRARSRSPRSTPASASPARPTPSRGSARPGPSWPPRASTP